LKQLLNVLRSIVATMDNMAANTRNKLIITAHINVSDDVLSG